MSTEYYRLKPPFTSARCTVGGGHTKLSLWVNHVKAGSITLRNEAVPGVLLALAIGELVLRKAIGLFGNVGEVSLHFMDDDLEPDTPLISEYGELTCLAEIDPTGELMSPKEPAE